MKKVIKNLILFSICLSLILFSTPAYAFIGTGLFDYFSSALEGIEETAGPKVAQVLLILFILFVGLIILWVSSSLLDMVISNPQWLTLKNPVVDSGLYFTTGLVNLFIVLFLIAIAIAWILKIETFAAKKALPKLILVALLVNFVRLFVAIPIDIATILHRTLLNAAGQSFIWQAVDAIYGGLWNMVVALIAMFIALSIMFLTPFVAPFAQYGFFIFAISIPIFGPLLLSWLIQMVISYFLSMLFFTLVFLFSCRVFVVWFLTIFAPLAFLCLVFPQTEKWWKEWLHHLFSWIFFGLIVLLFLVIGFRGAKYLRPGGINTGVPGMWWLSIPDYFYYYFFLFIFISLASWFSKKMAPEMADFLIAQGKMFGGTLVSAAKPVAGGLQRSAAEFSRQQQEREAAAREKAEKEGKKWETLRAGEKMKYLGRGGYLSGLVARPIARGYQIVTGKSFEELEEQRGRKIEGKAMRIETPGDFGREIEKHKERMDIVGLRAYARAAREKGKDFIEVVKQKLSDEEFIRMGARANRLGKTKEAESLLLMSADKLKNDPEKIKRMGFKSKEDLSEEEKKEWEEKGYKTYLDKVIQEIKLDDMKLLPMKEIIKAANRQEEWAKEIMKNDIQRGWGGHQYGRAAIEFGKTFIENFMEPIKKELEKIRELEKTDPQKAKEKFIAFVIENPKRASYLSSTAAQIAGYESIWERAPKSIRKEYKNIKEIIAKNPREEKREIGPKTAGAEFE